MELLQLHYFKELAESEHLTNTAKKLMISAPSLSLTISKLEHELGAPLFDRTGRSIRLNENGKVFYKYISKGLSQIDKGVKEVNERKEHAGIVLNLAIASDLLWVDCLNSFRQTHNYTINTTILSPEAVLAHKNWNYDFFMGITREIDKEFFQFQVLRGEEQPVVLIPKLNPLSDRETIDFRELKDETFISLCELNPSSYKFILDMCRLSDFEPHHILKATYFTRIKYLKENRGIALATDLGVSKNFISTDAFSVIPVIYPRLTRIQAIAWEKESNISAAGLEFLNFIIEYCKNSSML